MRHASIDILRSLAIVVMVVVHFGENLSGWTPPIAGLGAPVFAYLSGVSWVLWWRGRVAKGAADEEITRTTVRRGLFVFGVGILFNVIVWLPEDIFNWDVLTFVGSGLLFLEVARRMPRSIRWMVLILILLVAPVAREMVEYETYWTDRYFDSGFGLADVIIGYLVAGYFPLLPWLAFTLLGFLSADIVTGVDEVGDPTSPGRWLTIGGGADRAGGGARRRRRTRRRCHRGPAVRLAHVPARDAVDAAIARHVPRAAGDDARARGSRRLPRPSPAVRGAGGDVQPVFADHLRGASPRPPLAALAPRPRAGPRGDIVLGRRAAGRLVDPPRGGVSGCDVAGAAGARAAATVRARVADAVALRRADAARGPARGRKPGTVTYLTPGFAKDENPGQSPV